MPIGPRTPPADKLKAKRHPALKAEAIRLLAEHHILDVRVGNRGTIQSVKHVSLGWISPERYYELQKLHDLMPLIQEVIRWGYATNIAIYTLMPEVSLFGFGVPLPAGPGLLAAALGQLYGALKAQDTRTAAIAVYKLVGPFGALLQAYESLSGIAETYGGVTEILAAAGTKGIGQKGGFGEGQKA